MDSFNSNGDDMWDVLEVGSFAATSDVPPALRNRAPTPTEDSSAARDHVAATTTRLAAPELSFSNRHSDTCSVLRHNDTDAPTQPAAVGADRDDTRRSTRDARAQSTHASTSHGHNSSGETRESSSSSAAVTTETAEHLRRQDTECEQDVVYDLSSIPVETDSADHFVRQDTECQQDVVYDLSSAPVLPQTPSHLVRDDTECEPDALYDLCTNGQGAAVAMATGTTTSSRPAPRVSIACISLGESDAGESECDGPRHLGGHNDTYGSLETDYDNEIRLGLAVPQATYERFLFLLLSFSHLCAFCCVLFFYVLSFLRNVF